MDFVHRSLKTNFLYSGLPFSKVTYIGAGGKIGGKALPLFISNLKKFGKTEIVLVQSNSMGSKQRLTGMKMDIIEFAASIGKDKNIEINVAEDYSDTAGSDVTLCSAGMWTDIKTRKLYGKIDPTGRLVQSIVNAKMIKEIVKNVDKYSPTTLFITATNQVDTLSEIARKLTKTMPILGLSGCVDSPRLKRIAYEETGKNIKGKMIGYHNTSMIPLSSSIRGNLTEDEIAKIIKKCRMRGSTIAKNQAKGRNPSGDYGASILPAGALAKAALSFIGSYKEFTESWNVELKTQRIAERYGLNVGDSLSVPLTIGRGYVAYDTKYSINEKEKELIRKMRKEMISTVDKINSI